MDAPFLILTLLLLSLGLVVLFSASYAAAGSKSNMKPTYFISRQALFAGLGIIAMLMASRIDYHRWQKFALPLMLISLALLVIVLVPGIGVEHNKARRWLNLYITEFQPSELAKFAMILCFAKLINIMGPKRMKTIRYGILPFCAILAVVVLLLIKQPHLSAAITIVLTGGVQMFLGGIGWGWMVAAMGGLVAVVFAALNGALAFLPHAQKRVDVWLDPFSDFRGSGWQASQSLIAIGSGGFWGLGLGQGRQKHLYLPEPYNDFIFAVACEELGFVGAVLIIVAFAALIVRGYQIAGRAPDRFGMLLVVGITTQMALQTIINMSVVTGLMPVTGAALPFFSYGGTSLLMLMGEVGIVLSVSRSIPAPKKG